MKASSCFKGINNLKERNSQRSLVAFLVAIGSLSSLFIILRYGSGKWGDTYTYLYAWDSFLSKGVLDISRTPVYPFLLGIALKFFGDSLFGFAIIILQHIISLLSTISLYYTVHVVTKSNTISFCLSIFYILIANITWNSLLLTESLACSFVNGIVLFFSLLFLIFLRPAQLPIVVISFFMWLMVCKGRKIKNSLIGIISCTVVFVLLGFYAFQFKTLYGFYGISNVGDINQYYILRTGEMISSPNYKNTDTIDKHDLNSINKELTILLRTFGSKELHEMVEKTIDGNNITYYKKIGERFITAKDDTLFTFGNLPIISTFILVFSPHLNFIYFVLLVFPLFFLLGKRKNKMLGWISLYTYLILLSSVLTVIVGAPNDWGRLMYPSFPVLLVVIGISISFFLYDTDNENCL